jgi:hypothetical protein
MDSMTIILVGYFIIGFLIFSGFVVYWKTKGITYENLIKPETYKGDIDVDYLDLSIILFASISWIFSIPIFLVWFLISYIMKRTLGEK